MNIFETHPVIPPTLRLVQALLVHTCPGSAGYGSEFLFTTHCIHERPNGPLIGEGRLLDVNEQHALLTALSGAPRAQGSGYLPPDVIASSATQITWMVPGRVRAMWIRAGERIISLQVPWPTLLLCASHHKLALGALAKPERPDPQTPVYHAPLMNVHNSTVMCEGSATLPAGWSLEERAGYEAAVFKTNFSHINHPHTLRTKGREPVSDREHLAFWRKLAQSKSRRFPTRALMPLKITVAQWLRQHA